MVISFLFDEVTFVFISAYIEPRDIAKRGAEKVDTDRSYYSRGKANVNGHTGARIYRQRKKK